MPFATTPTGRLHYDVIDYVVPWVDDPPTIVFHHGVAANRELWSRWVPILGEYYRLLRLDMRGYGRSDAPPSDFTWSFDALADDLHCVLDHAGLERVHLVGESIGGTVALAYALREPQRVITLTLSNAAARGQRINNVASWRSIAERDGQSGWAEQMMRWRFHPGAIDSAMYQWFLQIHAQCNLQVTFTLADLLLDANFMADLARLSPPTLLLSPDASPFIKLELMTEMRDAIANAELQVFAHARHGLPLSHGPACARVLKSFLSRRS